MEEKYLLVQSALFGSQESEAGFSSMFSEASPKRGARPGLHRGKERVRVCQCPAASRGKQHAGSFQTHNFSPLKDTILSVCAFFHKYTGQWDCSTQALLKGHPLSYRGKSQGAETCSFGPVASHTMHSLTLCLPWKQLEIKGGCFVLVSGKQGSPKGSYNVILL